MIARSCAALKRELEQTGSDSISHGPRQIELQLAERTASGQHVINTPSCNLDDSTEMHSDPTSEAHRMTWVACPDWSTLVRKTGSGSP